MNDSFELVRQVLRILNFVSYVCLSVAICFSFFSALDILDNQFFSEYRILYDARNLHKSVHNKNFMHFPKRAINQKNSMSAP